MELADIAPKLQTLIFLTQVKNKYLPQKHSVNALFGSLT